MFDLQATQRWVTQVITDPNGAAAAYKETAAPWMATFMQITLPAYVAAMVVGAILAWITGGSMMYGGLSFGFFLFSLVWSLAWTFVIAFLFDILAGTFGGERNFNAAYALVGLAAGSEAGVSGVLIYFTLYLFMNLGTFACILSMRRGGRMVESLDDLAGLSRTHPLMAAALAAFMFSMAGVPPLAGFWGKLYVFQAAVGAELYVLAVIGVLTSVVSCFYYLRIVKLMYFDEASEPLDPKIGKEMAAVLLVSAAVVLAFIVIPGPITGPATAAAGALFGG